MKNVVTLLCLLVTLVTSAQFSGSGYYRVRNCSTYGYISIKGTHFLRSTYPDAFWSCILMQNDSAQVSDPGSIIYIDHIGGDCDLFSQGVSTYMLTHLMMTVQESSALEGGKVCYNARTYYEYMMDGQVIPLDCYFRDAGYGLTAGSKDKTNSRWWIEPVSEASIEESYFGVKPLNEDVVDSEGWYWTSLCCDFPYLIPEDGGVVGAYTVRQVEQEDDNCYYAEPELVYGPGEIVPAATPLLLKCKYPYASGNKLIPVGQIANRTKMPIVNDMLVGNYFSTFVNRCNMNNLDEFGVYVPDQATKASSNNLAFGIDENGRIGFFPQPEGTYMAANTAWLNVATMVSNPDKAANAITAVYLGEEILPIPPVHHGDVNGDGIIEISDVTHLIDYIVGDKSDPYNQVSMGADVNGDGAIDIVDVTELIDGIVYGSIDR